MSKVPRPAFTLVATGCACFGIMALWTTVQAADENSDAHPIDLTPIPLERVHQAPASHSNLLQDRSQFAGARACLDCHRSEYVAWIGSQHFRNSKKNRFEATESSIDTKYLAKTGNLNVCYNCHAAPVGQRFGRALVESGTSCESCHGSAGGEGGWLNRHAVYGPNGTTRENESAEHLAQRHAFLDATGMVRAGRPYEIAKNCFSCHIIAEPTLVSEDVKHPVSFDAFSLIPYMQGEVRHNFHTNQRQNAATPTLDTWRRGIELPQRLRLYLILEQFAKAEVALNRMASLPGDEDMNGDLADTLLDLFDDAAGEIEDFFDELEEPEDENIAGLSEEQLAPLATLVDIFDEFDDLDEPTRSDAAQSAMQVAAAARQFLAIHDGSQLQALDDAFIVDLEDPIGNVLAQ